VDALGLAGLSAALGRLAESRAGYARAADLGKRLRAALIERGAGVVLHGDEVGHLGHVVNFRSRGWKGDELVVALDLEGICVSSGSACSAGTAEPSAVIQAMLGREAALGAVRVSFGEESSEADLRTLQRALEKLRILRPES
jgi:cysteine desulfurase